MRHFSMCSGGNTKDAVSRNEDQNPAADAHNPHNSPPVLTFTYDELAKITNNFDKNSIIGEGMCGHVYKGTFEATGQIVAVKKLRDAVAMYQGDEEFSMDVHELSRLRHPHLVDLIGYCSEGDHRILVYEHMPLGSLDKHLHDRQPHWKALDWKKRMTIALGAARGLNYLHNEVNPRIIFRDLKTSNILLDQSLNPKLSDYGTAIFSDRTGTSYRAVSTPGYSALQFNTTTKADVYSFGVILLELITGRRPVDPFLRPRDGQPPLLCNWLRPKIWQRHKLFEVVDSALRNQFQKLSVSSAAELALDCLNHRYPEKRPTMEDVLCRMDEVVTQADQNMALTIREAGGETIWPVMRVEDEEASSSKGKGKAKVDD